MFLSILDFLGFNGPIILVAMNVIALWGRWYYILFFFLGAFLDDALNHLLKQIFQEPRPEKCKPTEFDPCTGSKPDYGMPSGHAESAVFCWTFLWCMFPKLSWFTAVGALLVVCTEIHRYVYRRHTLEQLLVGSLIGFFMAQLTLWSAEIFIRNYT
uniref:Phosphatidic acid phosphatase type 2/haloperoxidase domain-containing protein n=1 Tax=viral metagenome TaxID=1070528 RepID=A0A6C0HTV9_9ZZZZ